MSQIEELQIIYRIQREYQKAADYYNEKLAPRRWRQEIQIPEDFQKQIYMCVDRAKLLKFLFDSSKWNKA